MTTSNNNGQVHTNHIVSSGPIQMKLPGAMKMKLNVKEIFNKVKPVLEGVVWGGFITLGIVCIMLITAISAMESKCDGYGDRLGYAADVRNKQCHLKIDGEWKPLDSLKLVVEK